MSRAIRAGARAVAAACLLAAALATSATPALAATPVLPQPTATVRFLDGISFSGNADVGAGVHRLEIVVDVEGFGPSIVADVAPLRPSGTVDLGYVLATPGGSVVPNTRVTAHFRATLDDGTAVDGPSVIVSYEDTRFDWQVLQGDLVTVHWAEGPASFGRKALRIAEDAIRNVSRFLGVTESNRIDFFIYPDQASFYDVLGASARENIGGVARPEIRTLFAKIEPNRLTAAWVGVVIPHELTHVVFDTVVHNPYHDPPHWLDEGVAVYLAEGYGSSDRAAVADAASSGSLMPLRGLVGQFPTSGERFSLAYAESVSAVDFLVRRYGKTVLVDLLRSYSGGLTDDEAFQGALGTDTLGFETAWLDRLGASMPDPYGPVEAPPGPVPSGWVGQGPIPGEIPGSSVAPIRTPSVVPAAPDGDTGTAGGNDDPTVGLVILGAAVAGTLMLRARRGRPRAAGGTPEEPSPEEPAPEEPAA